MSDSLPKYHVLFDANILVYFVVDQIYWPLIPTLERLIDKGKIVLVLPKIVVDEYQRNVTVELERKIVTNEKHILGLSSSLEKVKSQFSKEVWENIDECIKALSSDCQFESELLNNSNRIESLIKKAKILTHQTSDYEYACDRALQKKAPFHRNKNSISDSIIYKLFEDYVKQHDKVECYFFTNNSEDFSASNNEKSIPHSDLEIFQLSNVYYANHPGQFLKERSEEFQLEEQEKLAAEKAEESEIINDAIDLEISKQREALQALGVIAAPGRKFRTIQSSELYEALAYRAFGDIWGEQKVTCPRCGSEGPFPIAGFGPVTNDPAPQYRRQCVKCGLYLPTGEYLD